MIVFVRFLADVNWMIIDEIFTLDKQFWKHEEEYDVYANQKMTVCPECRYRHANSPTMKELYEIADDWR